MMVELYRTILNIAPYAFAVGNKCLFDGSGGEDDDDYGHRENSI